METTAMAIDLAKNVFALCCANAAGQLIWRKELRRTQLLAFMRKLAPCLVGMEACGGAHYWARELAALGHEVRLVSPALVTQYRKGNKTDRNDAAAILEAVTRPTMRFVAVKSLAQQDLSALHRVRSLLLKNRTRYAISCADYCASVELRCERVSRHLSARCPRYWRIKTPRYQVKSAIYCVK